MKVISFIFLLLFCLNLNSQGNVESSLGLDTGVFTALTDYGTDNYTGSPFLYDDWRGVSVTTISGEEITAEEAKLDIWQHKLIIVKKDLQIAVNNHQVATLKINDSNGIAETFVKIGLDNELRFAKLHKNGDIKLFEILTKNFKKPSQGENASGYNKKPKASFSSSKKKFYISINDEELVELKTSKKGFAKSFPEGLQSKISRLQKSKKPNLKDTPELVSFLTQIEALL